MCWFLWCFADWIQEPKLKVPLSVWVTSLWFVSQPSYRSKMNRTNREISQTFICFLALCIFTLYKTVAMGYCSYLFINDNLWFDKKFYSCEWKKNKQKKYIYIYIYICKFSYMQFSFFVFLPTIMLICSICWCRDYQRGAFWTTSGPRLIKILTLDSFYCWQF